jgi:hypothetical protein
MAITATLLGTGDDIKGPFAGNPAASPLHAVRCTWLLSGTYVTGGQQIDLSTLFTNKRIGNPTITVIKALAFGDYFDGTNAWTADDASMVLASGAPHTNNLLTFKLFTGVNGTGGSEVANSTAVNGAIGFLFLCTFSVGSLGNV